MKETPGEQVADQGEMLLARIVSGSGLEGKDGRKGPCLKDHATSSKACGFIAAIMSKVRAARKAFDGPAPNLAACAPKRPEARQSAPGKVRFFLSSWQRRAH